MRLGPRLQIKQSQNLSLTPQLMQSIKLLQLGHLELAEFVNQEVEKNPLLERDEGENIAADLAESDIWSEIDNSDAQPQSVLSETIGSAEQIANNFDTDSANIFPEQVGQDSILQSTTNYNAKNHTVNSVHNPDIDSYTASKKSLSEDLREQAALMFDNSIDLLIAHHLINNLDERGYLDISCAEIATELGADIKRVENILAKLQTCEPTGIFARNLAECLAIQLKERNHLDPLMAKLLDNLHLVGAHDFLALERKIGANKEDILHMVEELRQLDPKPAAKFDGEPVKTIIADVFVRRGNNGEWEVELNSEILPRVLVNRTYYSIVSKKLRNRAEKSFLSDCLQSANWLTKSLDQRAQTILKVASEIVRVQNDFLRYGISHLKPMTLKMVAEEIEMHESTISRVSANKYISTPRGLFEMKYFFTGALSSNIGGQDHSAKSVQHKIKKLIDEEEANSILSDEKIAQILQKKLGVDIARRTVAKYREAMNIPSSVIRRRQKKSQL